MSAPEFIVMTSVGTSFASTTARCSSSKRDHQISACSVIGNGGNCDQIFESCLSWLVTIAE
jgi:hypothetical protein